MGASNLTLLDRRVRRALEIAVRFGGIEGDHHKAWVIDQMVRALCGVRKVGEQPPGTNAEYRRLVANACAGEDGPTTYPWETGVAP